MRPTSYQSEISRLPVLALIALMIAAAANTAQAAPRAELWPRWETQDARSTQVVNHDLWDDFLSAYVKPAADGINRVAYGRVTAADKTRLAQYLAQLQATPVSRLTRAEQRAYWINLYNAATVNVVLTHFPVASILKISISPGLFERGPWGKKMLRVEGMELSLNDIEHRILRPIWQDPRTHYAVNCASLGCPNLLPEAYTAPRMETQLESAARAFVNHPRGVRVSGSKLTVSSIYVWFQSDFGGTDSGVLAHLRRYANPALLEQLRGLNAIHDDDYDWTLNLAS